MLPLRASLALWLLSTSVVLVSSTIYDSSQAYIPLSLFGWGSNEFGQLGNGRRSLFESPGPVLRPDGSYFGDDRKSTQDSSFEKVTCAAQHCLALTRNNEVYGWGSNYLGQLGQQDVQGVVRHARRLSFRSNNQTNLQIGVTDHSSFVVDGYGNLFAAGILQDTQLTPEETYFNSQLSLVSNITGVRLMACARLGCVFIVNDPILNPASQCMLTLGEFGFAPLGRLTGICQPRLSMMTSISASFDHVIALGPSLSPNWIGYGDNTKYQMGDIGLVPSPNTYTEIADSTRAILACGSSTVKILNDGRVAALGRLANYVQNAIFLPVGPPSGNVTQISCIQDNIVFALGSDGLVYAYTPHGELGTQESNQLVLGQFGNSTTPLPLFPLTTVSSLMLPSDSANTMFVLPTEDRSSNPAVTTLFGAGSNRFGQLGLGRTSRVELAEPGLAIATSQGDLNITDMVSGGTWSAFVISSGLDKQVYWLGALEGSLGSLPYQHWLNQSFDSSTSTTSYPNSYTIYPMALKSLGSLKMIAASPSWFAYVTTNKAFRMISTNNSALSIAYNLPAAAEVRSLACSPSDEFGCYVSLSNSGAFSVMAFNLSLGNYTFIYPNEEALLLAVGLDFWLYSTPGNAVKGVGNNDKYQIPPGQFTFNGGVKVLSAGYYHSLVLHSEGNISSWGSNEYGQLGRTGNPAFEVQIPPPKIEHQGPLLWTSIAAVGYSSFAVLNGRYLYAWGRNGRLSQLGTDQVLGYAYEPLLISVARNWRLCSSCYSLFAARDGTRNIPGTQLTQNFSSANDALISFGLNQFGQLGFGAIQASSLPTFTKVDPTGAAPFASSLSGLNTAQYPAGFGSSLGVFLYNNSRTVRTFGVDRLLHISMNTNVAGATGLTASWNMEGRSAYSRPRDFSLAVTGPVSISTGGADVYVTHGYQGYELSLGSSLELQTSLISGIETDFMLSTPMDGYLARQPNGEWLDMNLFDLGRFRTATFSNNTDINGILTLEGEFHVQGLNYGCSSLIGITQVTSANNDRYIAFNSTGIYACGSDPTFGVLGRNAVAGQWNLVTRISPIYQVAAITHTNYALTDQGYVYAWGLNGADQFFGMPDCLSSGVSSTPTSCKPYYSPDPILIEWTKKTPWDLTGDRWVVQNIFVTPSLNAVHFYVTRLSRITSTPTTISTPSSPCPLPQPAAGFYCSNGAWVSNSSVVVAAGTEITIGGPSIVQGNVSIESGGSLVFTLPPIGSGAVLNVNGCITIDGSVIVTLTDDDLKEIDQQSGKSRESILVSAQCGSLSGVTNIAVSAPSDCRKASAQRSGSSDTSLTVVFRVDRSRCDRWWIILVSVLGGVILLVGILALLVTFTPLKVIVRPFTRRGVQPVMEKD